MTKKKMEKQQENYVAPIICAIVVVIALLAVVIATAVSMNGNRTKQDDDAAQVDDGEADYSLFAAMGSQDVLDFLDAKKTGFLYVGRPTCTVCQAFAPILSKVVKAEGYEVYYYDTDAANDNRDLKSEVLDVIGVTGVPTFMYVKDGVEVERLGNTASEDALREFILKYL